MVKSEYRRNGRFSSGHVYIQAHCSYSRLSCPLFIHLFMLLVSSKNVISSFHNALQASHPFPQAHCIYFCILMNVVCSQMNCLLIIFFFFKVLSFPQGSLHQGAVNGPASVFPHCSSGGPSIQCHFLSDLTWEFFYNYLAVSPLPLSKTKYLVLPTMKHPHTLFLDYSLTNLLLVTLSLASHSTWTRTLSYSLPLPHFIQNIQRTGPC